MKILIIEDDTELAEAMRFRLEKEDFTVDICHDGEEGLYYMQENMYDMVIMDRMLPSMNGTDVLKTARKAHISTPVIFLTALGELNDKVTGLECGADDYMVKPFAFEELLARIRCIMRRPGKWDDSALLKLGDISFDPAANRLSKASKECTLSRREGDLLEVFLRNPGQTLPRAMLLSRVWGMDADVEDGNLDNYIHFLRRRLKAVNSTLSLKTVRGVGYQLDVYL
ncbi:MAG: response regulator transcription factor [Blautia sp.]|nr:response regulator transcription factor [Blautia sp.]